MINKDLAVINLDDYAVKLMSCKVPMAGAETEIFGGSVDLKLNSTA